MGWDRISTSPNVQKLLACWGSVLRTAKNPVVGDDGLIHFQKPAIIDDGLWRFLLGRLFGDGMKGDGLSEDLLGMECFGEIAHDGAKVFRPTVGQWEAFKAIEMRFPCGEYRQPFGTLIIDLPESHTVTAKHTGNLEAPEQFREGDQVRFPVESIAIRHDSGRRIVFLGGICLSNGASPVMPLKVSIGDQSESLESALMREHRKGLEVHGPENMLAMAHVTSLFRPAMNACLFLANFGLKRIGRPDEKAWAHAEKQAKNKKAPAERRERNRLFARLMPEVFAIAQEIDLKDATAGPNDHDGPGGGGTVAPHWRRAHWASQPHGPGGSLRKLVFRKSSFVNRDRFAGSGLDATTTYRTATTG